MTLNGTAWTPIGPSPILESGNADNGMVSSIAIHPHNADVILIGTAGGGVWRTRDRGTTWTPLFDRELALGIGEPSAVAIDPNDTDLVYAGTSQRVILGTGNSGVFGPPDSSQGPYKSIDGGNSWVQLGSGFPVGNNGNATNLAGQDINVVVVDPADSTVLYLSSSSGVFRSSDGGLNWTAGNNAGGDARSLVLDASSPVGARILYAGVNGSGVLRSIDGGRNWSQILSGGTPSVATAVGATPKGFRKTIVALAPPASPPNVSGVQVLYVTLEGTGGASDPVGLFVSTDQGANWTQQAATGMPTRTQGGYSFHMAVDPASPGDGANDIIYFGAVGQAKSTDSGTSFSGLGIPHADTHAWAFVAQPSPTPSTVYCGNDGGVDVSTDGGSSWTALGSGALQTGLVFNIDVKPDATASEVVAAFQDNGLLTTAGTASPAWSSPQGGDGFDIAYDGVTPGRLYGTSGFWPAPCTRVFVSTADGTDLPSTVPSSQDVSPWGTSSDQNCGVFPVTTDPTNAGHVYVSGNQNLWQSQDGGSTWRKLSGFPGIGNVDVAAANGNNVVIAVGGQVFVCTNALASTGVAFTNITRNLPGRNVPRAVFDPIDPTVIYTVLGGLNGSGPGQSGHVFRTTIASSAWTDISPATGSLSEPLDVPFNAIALDGNDLPTTIYVGTDLGVLRSTDVGATWTVLDDIHLPRVPVTDLVLNPKAGVLCAGTYGRGVFKFTKPTGPSIAVGLDHGLDFGTVCGSAFLTIDVYNVGGTDLTVTGVAPLMGSGDFSVLPAPGLPLEVAPTDKVTFTVLYTPSVVDSPETAIIRITSDDPAAPFVDVAATGSEGFGQVATAIADRGNFGSLCVGAIRDEPLTINNTGSCPLSITDMAGTSEFLVPSVLTYPLLVNPGDAIDLPIRFQPSSFGTKSGTIVVISDDPASPHSVRVTGTAPPPRLALVIADKGQFGKCCVGSFTDEALVLSNSGECTLTITDIVSSSGEFDAPRVSPYPLSIEAGGSIEVPIRFEPTGFGPQTALITVTSDDPAGPRTVPVSGFAPAGKLAITGTAYFGGVKCGERATRTISVCNVGECDLHVEEVHFERRSRHWRLIHNPFPATLHAGSCLNVVIAYKATQSEPRPCELVIRSDEPHRQFRRVDVIAWTRCCCRDCCSSCRHGRPCDEHHTECCERHHHDCCGHHHPEREDLEDDERRHEGPHDHREDDAPER